ncbi:7135_t:CDS:2 [Acaulospora morrowiae]|uniref:7135_t:CDS:1 n=1 Tax=Acaulospora morrowiae TaxID=94023 RepID=A0A9N9BCC5_9GLOM|nr:7135_t:CDS:2 [Acaulospora morrowiae]
MELSKQSSSLRESFTIQDHFISHSSEDIAKFPSVEFYKPPSRIQNEMSLHSEIHDDSWIPGTKRAPSIIHPLHSSREDITEGPVSQNLSNNNRSTGNDDKSESESEESVKKVKPFMDENFRRTELQKKLYYFFEEPSTLSAKIFAWFSSIVIIVTIAMVCVESIPTIIWDKTIYFDLWILLDAVNVLIFLVEYFGRFYAATNKRKFVFALTNMIDLISILPFFVQLVTAGAKLSVDTTFKLLRTPRLLKVVKLLQITKYRTGFVITYRVFARSAYQIFIVFVYVLLIILVSSAVMWPLERGSLSNDNVYYRVNEDGVVEKSPFQSIVHCFWWSMVTLTTTGYGDSVPATPLGKLIAGFTMLCGILVIALPTSILGSNLVTEWSLHQRLQFQTRLQKQFEELNKNETDDTKRMRDLEVNNEAMFHAIADIQELLANFNPPKYYRKYRDLKSMYLKACGRINELEDKVEQYKRINKNLSRFNDLGIKSFRKNDDKDDDNDEGTMQDSNANSMKSWKWKKSKTTDTFSRSSTQNSADGVKHSVPKGLRISPMNTLRRIGKPFSRIHSRDDLRIKLGTEKIKKEFIGSPKEMRMAYMPINDEKHVTPMIRSESEPLSAPYQPNLNDISNSENKKSKIITDSTSMYPFSTDYDEGGGERMQKGGRVNEGSANQDMIEINDEIDDKIEIIVGNSFPENVEKSNNSLHKEEI